MRGGRMTGRELFRTRSAAEEAESLATFITSYYDPGRLPPPKIYLDAAGRDGQEALSFLPTIRQWFTDTLGTEPELIVSNEKHHRAILALARQNALDDIRRRVRERGAGPALEELAAALNLKTKPERIEGFDIAQLDGKHPVASLISFKNGIPDRKQYRHFKLKTVIGIVDDFAAMREAVSRRYNRLLREGGELPNLILIDGGIGQVNAARGVLDELGLDLDLVGLAKRNEEIWLPHTGEPLRLSKRSEALKILQFVRDETHRFATGLNQRLRSRDLSLKALESVEGIGPKRAAAALKAYASVKALSEAAVTDIAARCGISETTAGALRAAAKLALEDQEKSKKKLAASSEKRKGGIGAALAAEAAALRGSYKNSPAADGEAASAEPDYPEP
jgi:excinuclease ABC subunit C